MFSPEPWRQRTLFEWVVDGGWLAKVLSERHYQTSHQLAPEPGVRGRLCDQAASWLHATRIHHVVVGLDHAG